MGFIGQKGKKKKKEPGTLWKARILVVCFPHQRLNTRFTQEEKGPGSSPLQTVWTTEASPQGTGWLEFLWGPLPTWLSQFHISVLGAYHCYIADYQWILVGWMSGWNEERCKEGKKKGEMISQIIDIHSWLIFIPFSSFLALIQV